VSILRRTGKFIAAGWYEKIACIFVGIIIMRCLTIFEGYWWEDTFRIVYGTLLAAIVIDVLLPVKRIVTKAILQLIGAVVITAAYVDMKWYFFDFTPQSTEEWFLLIKAHAVQLHPFIWISGAILLLHVLFGIWMHKRFHMFIFVGLAILLLAIVDSFTPIWLWDEVAWVVFIGLLWLVASHMRRLQDEHPDSWKELLEYPIQLVLPIIVIVSVLMLAGMNMPSVSPLLQDPYTMWKESKGERVTVFLGDKLPDTQSPLGTGNSSSGYSRNDDQLGGGFDYDYSTMMTVSTTQRSYWRGETKAFYTGEGWMVTGNERADDRLTKVPKGVPMSDGDLRPLAETTKVEHIVTMVREDAYPVLFAASPVSQVNWLDNPELGLPSHLLWNPLRWELRLNDAVDSEYYPTTYSVTSEVTVLDEEKLRLARSAGVFGSDSPYLQLPDTVTDRVRQLADEVTAEGTNDYDRAKLIEQYLKLNYSYNNKPDLSKLTGQSSDFVDQFLFELQEGYCDYFSTTMAVMARSLGLPARWVKGFAPGVLPASSFGGPPGEFGEEEMNPSGAGVYTVRNSDAHSWVEIYFEGYGWIGFEPTAGFSYPYRLPEGAAPVLPEIDNSPTTESPAEDGTQASNGGLFVWLASGLLLTGAAAALLFNRNKIVAAWRRYRHGSYTANDRIVLETNKLFRFCRKRGYYRDEHETLRESILRWSHANKRLRDDFRIILDGFERAKYGSAVASEEEADRFVVKARAIIEELK